jgi:signal peptidase II
VYHRAARPLPGRPPEPKVALNEQPSRLPLLAVGAAAAIVDLATKAWIFSAIPYLEERRVLGDLVSFRPIYNTAGPWSWGHGWEWVRYALPPISVVAVIVILRILRETPAAERAKRLGFTLILGGAVGNLWDRVHALFDTSVGVRDFVLVKGVWFQRVRGEFVRGDFPSFNVADACITVGVVLVAWTLLFEGPRQEPAAAPAAEAAA